MGGAAESLGNEAWIAALRGESADSGAAIRDLEAYLRRVLRRVMSERPGAEALDELVQDSLARIVESLGSFRGDSAFKTWATTIATRVAFTEIRRRQYRARRTETFDETARESRELANRRHPSPVESLSRSDILAALETAIETRLTERQRIAILAELRGVPTVAIAERLGTNQNALYKLTHDARRKLRAALLEAGYTADSLGRAATETPR